VRLTLTSSSYADLILIHRTSTPLRVEHEISIKIFFSVQGETRQGERMKDPQKQGEVRMLVVAVPVVIASVSVLYVFTNHG
jgi:hypothetical protein